MLGAWMAGRLAVRVPMGRLAIAGIAINVAGLWTIATWTQASPLATVGVSLLAQGVGVGLFQVGYTDYVARALPLGDRGVAGSLAMITRTIGIVLGATILSEAFTRFEAEAHASETTAAAAFLFGFQSTFRYTAIGLGLCLAFSLLSARAWRIRT
jgi:hypothetical protein